MCITVGFWATLAVAGVGTAGAYSFASAEDNPNFDQPASAAVLRNFEATDSSLSSFEAAHPFQDAGAAPAEFQPPPAGAYNASSYTAAQLAAMETALKAEGKWHQSPAWNASSQSPSASDSTSTSTAPALGTEPGGTYGMADASGQFLNYYTDPFFSAVRSGLPIADARFFVTWDAFGTASGSTCTNNSSSTYTTAQLAEQRTLYFSLAAAQQDGLDPLISIASGSATNPLVPGDGVNPTNAQYDCGFAQLVDTIHNIWNLYPFASEYEIYNEPDTTGVCAVSTDPTNGAASADGYYVDASFLDNKFGLNPDSLIAGAFGGRAMNEGPDCGGGQYMPKYLAAVENDFTVDCTNYAICDFPWAMSGHPYDDVDDSYSSGQASNETTHFVNAVNSANGVEQLWLTEAAAVQSYANAVSGPLATGCPAGPGHSDTDPNDNGGVSACVDDSGIHQANAAHGFMNLATVGDVAGSSYVARVYWYEFEQSYNFDSALMADDNHVTNGRSTDCPAGVFAPSSNPSCTGQPRTSYCMLQLHPQGYTASQCAGNVNYNDYHTIAAGTYAYGNHLNNQSNECVVGGTGPSCCLIDPSAGGTPFNSVTVVNDDWLDLEQGEPDPCFRQTGGQG
jgi:hypothetical protein